MIDMYIYIYIYPKYGLIQTLRFNRQTCGIVGIEWDFFYGTIMDKKLHDLRRKNHKGMEGICTQRSWDIKPIANKLTTTLWYGNWHIEIVDLPI